MNKYYYVQFYSFLFRIEALYISYEMFFPCIKFKILWKCENGLYFKFSTRCLTDVFIEGVLSDIIAVHDHINVMSKGNNIPPTESLWWTV